MKCYVFGLDYYWIPRGWDAVIVAGVKYRRVRGRHSPDKWIQETQK